MGQLVNHASDLCDGIIRVVGGLHALVPTDAHTHVGRLDHPDVIGAVPDGEGDGIHPLLNHVHDLGLLQGRHSGREEGKTVTVCVLPGETAAIYISLL